MLYEIEVVNARGRTHELRPLCAKADETGYFYVGRAYAGFSASALANPYKVIAGNRDKAIRLYRNYLGQRLMHSEPATIELLDRMMAVLIRDYQVHLVCWCAPEKCHADIIRTVLLRRLHWFGETVGQVLLALPDGEEPILEVRQLLLDAVAATVPGFKGTYLDLRQYARCAQRIVPELQAALGALVVLPEDIG